MMTGQAVTMLLVQIPLFFNCLLSFSLKNCTVEYGQMEVVLCQSNALTEIPDDIPKNADELDVSFNHITEIKRTDLGHLSELAILIASHNHLNHIDDNAFTNVKKLKMLRLSYNKLTKLTKHTFEGLDKLVSLYLDNNHITQVSRHAFQSLTSLHAVYINNNYIHSIKDIATLFQLPNIQSISLGTNNFTSFDSDELPFNTTKVSSIVLESAPITKFSLKQDIFSHLQYINLYNSIKNTEWDIVNKTFLRSLTGISLGGIRMSLDTYNAVLRSTTSLQKIVLESINKTHFSSFIKTTCSIPTLKILKISFNQFQVIDNDVLSLCSNLTDLSLPLNDLEDMSEHALKSMTNIRHLSLNANALQKVPETIRGLSTLETLDLSINYIKELSCYDFAHLKKLKELSLRKNQIARLEKCVFEELRSLKQLDMGNNRIHSLNDAFAVKMSKLDTLILSDNWEHLHVKESDFSTLSSLRILKLYSKTYYLSQEGAFKDLNHLKSLILSVNIYTSELFEGLTQLENLQLHLSFIWNMRDSQNHEPPFSGLPNLKSLSVKAYGKYTVIPSPDILKGLKSLQSFTADNIFHASIHPDTFKYTPKLVYLKIRSGDLSTLTPELFEPIPDLQQLDLSNNTFQTIDFLANLKALQELKITENKLTVMNHTLFQTLPALRYLDLTNNPLSCDCLNVGFRQWVLTNNQTQVINGHQYKCAFPASQQGHRFLDFDSRSCWIDVGFICFTSSACLILFTLTASFVFHFLRFQLAYAYHLFLAYLYDNKTKRRGAGYLYDAFISYNVHDEDWVYNEMLPVLEGEQGWRLCLHHRDFEPGKPIVENITDAIYSSSKTICVISRHYLQSEWCSREIQMASVRLFDEQKDVLILVFLEDIPTWQLSPYYQMRRVVKKSTYLSWPQAAQHKGVFWQKINQALNADNNPNDNRHLIIEPEEAN